MINKDRLPRHIAFIMDGNGRWAKLKSLPRTAGHREGAKRVKEIVKASASLGIEVVTFFAFSTENWNRPQNEIDMLLRYLENFLDKEVGEMNKKNIRFKVIGEKDPLQPEVLKKIRQAEDKTKSNTGLTVVMALNYGSRQEIVDAVRRFAKDVALRKVDYRLLDTEKFASYLYTSGIPDPDLLIRTSGEERISNFLLWQLSYAELFFTGKFWPEFKEADLLEAVKEYQSRNRRFGRV